MKNLIHYTINLLFLGLFFISCEEESLVTTFGSSEGTTLTLKLSSRATVTNQNPVPGENPYNENVIKSISCFLYPSGTSLTETDETKMVAKHNLNVSDNLDNTLGEQTVTITLNNDEKELLFPNGKDGDQCDIYVIANLETTGKDNVVDLKNTAITASFDKQDIQTSFVMDGDVEKVVLSGNKIVTPEDNPYNLQRAASKIKLSVTKILNKVTDAAGNEWEPAYSVQTTKDENGTEIETTYLPMYLRFYNGVKEATVDVGVENGRPNNSVINDGSYFSIKKTGNNGSDRNVMTLPGTSTDGWLSLTDIKNIPFYSYSSDWGTSSNKEAYLALIVPWKNGETVKNCYYQIPINSVGSEKHPANCLERNTYYQINLEVGMLGSFDPEEPMLLKDASYVITEWVPEAVNVELNNYRYLIVEKNKYILNNVNELYIPYASSHIVKLDDEISCTQIDLSKVGADPKNVTDYTLEIDSENRRIYFSNTLINDMTNSGFDFTPITLTFTIRHNDAETARWMEEEITIIQYPALYAMAKINTDYSDGIANNGVSGIGGTKGFVWVNGYNTASVNNWGYNFFGSVHGIYEQYGDNNEKITNPNMYVITVTSLGSNPRNYVIGDPRVNESDDDFIDDYSWYPAKHFINGTVGTSNNHTLQYYYPTDYTSRTSKMIAPKFRVASAYSVTYGVADINLAKGRCASYQEDGYPAGRWRMPTHAEYEFIVYQSRMGRIPTLFSSTDNYWCAHGYGQPQTDGTVKLTGNVNSSGNLSSDKDLSIRCVYDEWYWEDRLEGTNKVPFTWGDAEKK